MERLCVASFALKKSLPLAPPKKKKKKTVQKSTETCEDTLSAVH